jgi:hypothetical protein
MHSDVPPCLNNLSPGPATPAMPSLTILPNLTEYTSAVACWRQPQTSQGKLAGKSTRRERQLRQVSGFMAWKRACVSIVTAQLMNPEAIFCFPVRRFPCPDANGDHRF